MKKITVIGGDDRLRVVADALQKENYAVNTLGLYDKDDADITGSDVILLPVPTTRDSKTVFCPLTGRHVLLSQIQNDTHAKQLILCCNYRFDGRNCIDYGSLDSYAILNAVPTAEGAIRLAIENTPYTLWQSRVLVIGYGRVGKILADRLRALGCFVTVSGRKSADFAMLDALGFSRMHTERLGDSPLEFDIVFNTVDAVVIDDAALKDCRARLLIDLSTRGGFSIEAAKKLGINAIKAPGLPGQISPMTASKILFATVTDLINQYT